MEPMSGHFIPPLLVSVPTGQVTFAYVGADIEWQSEQNISPLRCAKNGHLSVYGHQADDFGRVVIGVSFEEDDLPILNRQTYYHYLEGKDTVHIADFHVTFIFNNFPVVQPPDQAYKRAVAWRIQFAPDTLDTVRSLLEHINTSGSWRRLAPVSCLQAEEQSALYYSLRSTLIEQPIPQRLGTLGHWQSRLPGGTPSHMPYLEDRYRAENIEMKKQAVFCKEAEIIRVKKMAAEAQAILDMQVVHGAPEWNAAERGSPEPNVSLVASPQSETAKVTVQMDDGLDTQTHPAGHSKQTVNAQQQLKAGSSAFLSNSNSPKSTRNLHATNGISASLPVRNGTPHVNGANALHGESAGTKASSGESNGRISLREIIPTTPDMTLPTDPRDNNKNNGTHTPPTKYSPTSFLFLPPSPSLRGSQAPHMLVRAPSTGKSGVMNVTTRTSDRKISLSMTAHLRNGKTAPVELVVPDEDTAGQVWADPQLLSRWGEHGHEIKPPSELQEEVPSPQKAVSFLEKAISDFVEEEDGGGEKVEDEGEEEEEEEDTAVGVV